MWQSDFWYNPIGLPLLSRAMSAVLADRMATLLNIQNKWKVFESFWGMKGLRSAYNNALNQKQFDEFYEKLKNNIRWLSSIYDNLYLVRVLYAYQVFFALCRTFAVHLEIDATRTKNTWPGFEFQIKSKKVKK